MRTMLTIRIPVEAGSAAIRDGRFPKILSGLMERTKPEAAYFTSTDGDRSAIVFFDLAHPSDIPAICEPLFTELHAKVTLVPVMTADDVQAGLAKLA